MKLFKFLLLSLLLSITAYAQSPDIYAFGFDQLDPFKYDLYFKGWPSKFNIDPTLPPNVVLGQVVCANASCDATQTQDWEMRLTIVDYTNDVVNEAVFPFENGVLGGGTAAISPYGGNVFFKEQPRQGTTDDATLWWSNDSGLTWTMINTLPTSAGYPQLDQYAFAKADRFFQFLPNGNFAMAYTSYKGKIGALAHEQNLVILDNTGTVISHTTYDKFSGDPNIVELVATENAIVTLFHPHRLFYDGNAFSSLIMGAITTDLNGNLLQNIHIGTYPWDIDAIFENETDNITREVNRLETNGTDIVYIANEAYYNSTGSDLENPRIRMLSPDANGLFFYDTYNIPGADPFMSFQDPSLDFGTHFRDFMINHDPANQTPGFVYDLAAPYARTGDPIDKRVRLSYQTEDDLSSYNYGDIGTYYQVYEDPDINNGVNDGQTFFLSDIDCYKERHRRKRPNTCDINTYGSNSNTEGIPGGFVSFFQLRYLPCKYTGVCGPYDSTKMYMLSVVDVSP